TRSTGSNPDSHAQEEFSEEEKPKSRKRQSVPALERNRANPKGDIRAEIGTRHGAGGKNKHLLPSDVAEIPVDDGPRQSEKRGNDKRAGKSGFYGLLEKSRVAWSEQKPAGIREHPANQADAQGDAG